MSDDAPEFAWVNGRIVPAASASVSIFDRGFLFGDGVYELVRFFGGVGLQLDEHVARLRRSLAESRIAGVDAALLAEASARLLEANGLRDASVYFQATRGAAPVRTHAPPSGLRPTVIAIASPMPALASFVRPEPVRVRLMEEIRWRRCDIKSTSLMGNILAVIEAAAHDAQEAILLRGPLVGEGASTSVLALVDGVLVTPPAESEPPILPGVTRLLAESAADEAGVPFRVGELSVAALLAAPEVMLASSRRIVAPVVAIDGTPVGDGRPGPVCDRLFAALRRAVARRCGIGGLFADERAASPAPTTGGAAR